MVATAGKSRWGILGRILRKIGKNTMSSAPGIANMMAPGSGAMLSAAKNALQGLMAE
jgi:hypothetical protein